MIFAEIAINLGGLLWFFAKLVMIYHIVTWWRVAEPNPSVGDVLFMVAIVATMFLLA